MAFRTNKTPAIEERTVSGSSVSFNSAFALPLKACKVSFEGTQEGSGTPSPSNPRSIVGVSSIDLSVNGTSVSVSLGENRYGGYIDVLKGRLVITHQIVTLDGNNNRFKGVWGAIASGYAVYANITEIAGGTRQGGVLSDKFEYADVPYTSLGLYQCGSSSGAYSSVSFVLPNTITSLAEANAWLAENNTQLWFPLITPTEVQLSANELSSIIGNNTFSTDTGTLEITFSDLQEKSASGSVATFNTALAMPLSSCNIAVNAWQEGSGDPNPIDNIRPIHGFSEVNETRAGKNLFDYDSITISNITFNGTDNQPITRSGFIYHLPSGRYTISERGEAQPYVYLYIMARNGDFKQQLVLSASTQIWQTVTFTLSEGDYFVIFNAYQGRVLDISSNEFMIEAGSTATAYEPYVTPTIYPIQLGQEVYGAEVDVVNGVAHVTHGYREYDGSENWVATTVSGFPCFQIARGVLPTSAQFISNYIKRVVAMTASEFIGYVGGSNFNVRFTSDTTLEQFQEILSNDNMQIVYELAIPFDIQLTPTQIETLIGNNTIFADTGDIDLTYKDLDIAKRGNFREVFKLPS